MNTKRKETKIIAMPSDLEAKIDAYMALQATMADVRKKADDLKQEIVSRMGRLPCEGTTHKTVGNFDVKVITKVKRQLDQSKAVSIIEQLPDMLSNRVFTSVYKLSLRELRYMEEHEPDNYRLVRGTFVTSKGQPTLTITRVG